MPRRSGAVAGRRAVPPSRRFALLGLSVAAHLAAIWLLLQRSPVTGLASDAGPSPTVFDLAPEPPPPPPPPPPPFPRRRAAVDAGAPRGGSPGARRERPARRTDLEAPPAREAIDVTPVPTAPPASPLPAAGSAPIDLGAGGAGGAGEGTGAGTGRGDGDGAGAEQAAFARAEWIKRPPQWAYRQHWPFGRQLPDHSVTVRVSCRVRRNGSPYRCRPVAEHPPRSGFQDMVLRAVVAGKVRPVARDGTLLWDVPVLITVVLDRLIAAPRVTAVASAPPAPARP